MISLAFGFVLPVPDKQHDENRDEEKHGGGTQKNTRNPGVTKREHPNDSKQEPKGHEFVREDQHYGRL